jgi:alanyl-tRNA synthetase
VGDRGTLYGAHTGETVAVVEDTRPAVPGLTVHKIRTVGALRVGDELRAEVGISERWSTMRNHTATHLLHAALRQVLGVHVKQAGSVVEPPRLRFDFTHYAAVDPAEKTEIERLVNQQILRNTQVTTNVMPIDQAISTGAMALFGEKYGDQVRVVSIPDFSKELCGGTHVTRTGDIGVFKIVSESSISAGVRRIEAITGEGAVAQFQESSEALHRIAGMLRVGEPELVEQVDRLIAEKRVSERQIEQLKTRLAQSAMSGLELKAKEKGGARVLIAQVEGLDRQQMRTLADALRNKWKSAVIVLASTEDGAVSIVAGVTKDLTAKIQAGKLVGTLSQAVGGKGGGRPDMAEGGGKDPAALAGALASLEVEVEGKL